MYASKQGAAILNDGRENHWVVVLNQYQRDNLIWLLNGAANGEQMPLAKANTGDWLNEIRWMLQTLGGQTDTDPGRPNVNGYPT